MSTGGEFDGVDWPHPGNAHNAAEAVPGPSKLNRCNRCAAPSFALDSHRSLCRPALRPRRSLCADAISAVQAQSQGKAEALRTNRRRRPHAAPWSVGSTTPGKTSVDLIYFFYCPLAERIRQVGRFRGIAAKGAEDPNLKLADGRRPPVWTFIPSLGHVKT